MKSHSPSPSKSAARLALGGLLALAACRSPEEHRADADREVYALIDARRAQLFDAEGEFDIDRPADTLRSRMLAGEWEPGASLSLAELLEVAAENSRTFQDRREALYRAALDLTFERWRFSNQGFASLGASGTAAESGDSVSVDGGVGFTQLLGSGATLVANLGQSLFRFVSTGDGWDLIGSAGLSFTQPLLRGAGRRIVREPLTQAERSLIYEVRAYERFRRRFAVDVARSFYNLLFAIDQLANEVRNLENLKSLRERNEALAQAGRLSDIQVDQARQDELRSENRLLDLTRSLQRRRDDFKLLLGLPIEVELSLDPAEFARLSEVDTLLDELTAAAAIDVALGARLDYLTVLDRLVDRERGVYIAANALEPDLALSLGIDSTTPAGQPVGFDAEGTTYTGAVGFDLAIERLPQRNAYRAALIAQRVAIRDVERSGDEIRVDVRDALRLAIQSAQSYAIQRGAVGLAERRVESARLTLEAGRASTRDLLEAQSALVEAQNAATRALIDFTLARLELYLAMEVLRVDEDGIAVDEASLRPVPQEITP